jgi:hypothetical protein
MLLCRGLFLVFDQAPAFLITGENDDALKKHGSINVGCTTYLIGLLGDLD